MNNMKKSIKTRLVKKFMFIIMITVIILVITLVNGVKTYHYNNMDDILTSQLDFSIEYYLRYFSSTPIEDIILDDVDVFWKHTNAQVQVLNNHGDLLMDSLGVLESEVKTPDVQKAIGGKKGLWIGKVSYYDEQVMSVSKPIIDNEDNVGIIRFIISLHETNESIKSISVLIVWLGLFVIVISGIVSIFLANSIVRPLKEVTDVAEKMADGQFRVRSYVEIDDEIGRLSDTLNYMAEEILKKEQIKNDFISSISHELRTPLTSIKGWAATLKTLDFKDEILIDGLDIIEAESDRLTNMVEELLDFSRFVSGRIRLEKEFFNIRNTLYMIEKQLKPRAKTNSINFSLHVGDEVANIIGDENRIKQVFINLLDNAFKFTDEGGNVELKADVFEDDLIIKVIDDGMGISGEDLPYVKEKFYKGKSSKSHSGIGLSICDEIISLHDGTFEIESEEGKGTRIVVTLPLKGGLNK